MNLHCLRSNEVAFVKKNIKSVRVLSIEIKLVWSEEINKALNFIFKKLY